MDIADCGGQPQFLEMLSKVTWKNVDFAIVVIDLCLSLNAYPTNYYYSEEGKSVGVGVPSPLTNEQVLRLFLRMIASQSQGDRPPVKFAIVGTHRDLEGTCVHTGKDGKREHEEGARAASRERRKIRRLQGDGGVVQPQKKHHHEGVTVKNSFLPSMPRSLKQEDHETVGHSQATYHDKV